jgi:hypothetical protein
MHYILYIYIYIYILYILYIHIIYEKLHNFSEILWFFMFFVNQKAADILARRQH